MKITHLCSCALVLSLSYCLSTISVRAEEGRNEVRDSDTALNRAYQKALAALSSGAKAALRESQRAWIAFRDAEAGVVTTASSATPLEIEAYQTLLNRNRAEELKALQALLTTSGGAAKSDADADVDVDGMEPIPRRFVVACKVGLIVHATADGNSRRVGTLEDGQKITLAGKLSEDGNKVYAVEVKDHSKENGGATWIKISAPYEGFILYTAADGSAYITVSK